MAEIKSRLHCELLSIPPFGKNRSVRVSELSRVGQILCKRKRRTGLHPDATNWFSSADRCGRFSELLPRSFAGLRFLGRGSSLALLLQAFHPLEDFSNRIRSAWQFDTVV